MLLHSIVRLMTHSPLQCSRPSKVIIMFTSLKKQAHLGFLIHPNSVLVFPQSFCSALTRDASGTCPKPAECVTI